MHRHHAVDYIELAAHDIALAKKFYGAAFGWKFTDYGPEYAGIQGEGREQGGLREDKAYRGVRGGPLIILFSERLDETVKLVKKAGGTITTPPFEFPGGRRFHFTDPSGNELAVWSEK
ncbi:MAG: VOC family protein [Myxococcaceae bacterium]|mgnify:CR=1 FL=1